MKLNFIDLIASMQQKAGWVEPPKEGVEWGGALTNEAALSEKSIKIKRHVHGRVAMEMSTLR